MNNNRNIITVVVLVVVVALIGWYLAANDLLPGQNKTAKASDWQALFLTNGQVYFGKLSNESGKYLNLKDIYYLQVAQSGDNKDQTNQQAQISLVKLGNELHGPTDEMRINRDQVLFIESMKNDSKVVDAIERYKKDGPTPVSSPVVQTTPSK